MGHRSDLRSIDNSTTEITERTKKRSMMVILRVLCDLCGSISCSTSSSASSSSPSGSTSPRHFVPHTHSTGSTTSCHSIKLPPYIRIREYPYSPRHPCPESWPYDLNFAHQTTTINSHPRRSAQIRVIRVLSLSTLRVNPIDNKLSLVISDNPPNIHTHPIQPHKT